MRDVDAVHRKKELNKRKKQTRNNASLSGKKKPSGDISPMPYHVSTNGTSQRKLLEETSNFSDLFEPRSAQANCKVEAPNVIAPAIKGNAILCLDTNATCKHVDPILNDCAPPFSLVDTSLVSLACEVLQIMSSSSSSSSSICSFSSEFDDPVSSV